MLPRQIPRTLNERGETSELEAVVRDTQQNAKKHQRILGAGILSWNSNISTHYVKEDAGEVTDQEWREHDPVRFWEAEGIKQRGKGLAKVLPLTGQMGCAKSPPAYITDISCPVSSYCWITKTPWKHRKQPLRIELINACHIGLYNASWPLNILYEKLIRITTIMA